MRFLRAKFSEMRRRLARHCAVRTSQVLYTLGLRDAEPLQLLEKINDQANDRFCPQPYSGRVTLFKPRKAYLGYEDPTLGWGNGLVRDIELIELPVYPAGMLIEPFVQELAAHLRRCLDDANASTQAGLSPIAEQGLLSDAATLTDRDPQLYRQPVA
jgi:hypothetical protein